MPETNDLVLWLWLANGMGPAVDWLPLWDAYGDVRAIWENRAVLQAQGLVTEKQAQRLLGTSLNAMARRAALHEEKGVRILVWNDIDYPAQLRAISTPPVVLYTLGDVACLQNRLLLGVVGSRHPSGYGMEATRRICEGLVEGGAVLVSGLADGLDSEAHRACVRAGKPTVAVLGNGVDKFYPARNRELQNLVARTGVLVSEYPCGEDGNSFKAYFVQRNRIIAGLSQGLCVAEAKVRSGTMSTVRYAAEYGRDIYAVPGSIFSELSEGTNLLIKEGAKPVTCAGDILEEYGLCAQKAPEKRPPASASDLEGDLLQVYRALPGADAMDVQSLQKATGLTTGALMAAITRLELRELVRRLPGGRVERAL